MLSGQAKELIFGVGGWVGGGVGMGGSEAECVWGEEGGDEGVLIKEE